MKGRTDIVERARALLISGRHVTTAGLADALWVSRALVVIALRADGGFRRIDDGWELEEARPVTVPVHRPVNGRPPGRGESPLITWLRAAGRWCSYRDIAAGTGWKYGSVVTFFYNLRANGRMGTIRQRTVGTGTRRHFELLWEEPTV